MKARGKAVARRQEMEGKLRRRKIGKEGKVREVVLL